MLVTRNGGVVMPDITMCYGYCPLQETCYRYNATPSMWQAYFVNTPYKNGKCDFYWHMKKFEDVKR